MLHLAVESAFEHLLATWREHQSLERTTVSLQTLASSRLDLERARSRMHQIRAAIYPENDEIEGIAQSMWCESLAVVVHLRWVDRHPTNPSTVSCACGEIVPIESMNVLNPRLEEPQGRPQAHRGESDISRPERS